MKDDESWRALGVIVLIGLVLRISALVGLSSLEFPDTSAYLIAGAEIFSGSHVSNNIYMPLFPIWAHILGGGIFLKLGDVALSTASIILIYYIVRHLSHSVIAAALAALMMALYPHFVFFSVARLSETLYIFLTCAAFLMLFHRRFGLGSLLLVLSILTRPTTDYLAPLLIVIFSFVVLQEGWRKSILRLATYALIYGALLAPWWAHNYTKYGEFVRLSLGDGTVLYSGNNPLNKSGGGVAWAKKDISDDMDMSQFDSIKNPIKRNQAMKDAAFDYISDNPGRFVELVGLKLIRLWRLWPYAEEYKKPHIIVASIVSYGPVLVLFVLSLFTVLPRALRRLSPIIAFIGYLTAVHMVTIGSVRYRIPMEPFLIVMGAMALAAQLERMPAVTRLLRRTGLLMAIVDTLPKEAGGERPGSR